VISKYLVVNRVLRISEIEYNSRVRLRTTTIGKLLGEIDGAIKPERAILIDINVQCLEVCRSVDDTNVAGLHKVIGDNDVLLVGSDLDVVRPDGRLIFIGVVEALDVVQVGDVESGNVVGGGEGDCDDLLVSRTTERVVLD
jgi:hypothetical protein